MGSAPIAPPSTVQLIKVNSSSIVLDLASWVDGGCPITSFVVEYQKIRSAIKPATPSSSMESDISLTREVTISVDEHPYSGNFIIKFGYVFHLNVLQETRIFKHFTH